MGYFKFLLAGWSGLKELRKFSVELNARGVKWFSEQGAREIRKWMEIKALRAAMYEDTKIAKVFTTYGCGIRWFMTILKSDQLGKIDVAMGDDQALSAAIAALDDKQTLYTKPTYPAH